jgi:hypothetical protein
MKQPQEARCTMILTDALSLEHQILMCQPNTKVTVSNMHCGQNANMNGFHVLFLYISHLWLTLFL